jgi:hypothetical protein
MRRGPRPQGLTHSFAERRARRRRDMPWAGRRYFRGGESCSGSVVRGAGLARLGRDSLDLYYLRFPYSPTPRPTPRAAWAAGCGLWHARSRQGRSGPWGSATAPRRRCARRPGCWPGTEPRGNLTRPASSRYSLKFSSKHDQQPMSATLYRKEPLESHSHWWLMGRGGGKIEWVSAGGWRRGGRLGRA